MMTRADLLTRLRWPGREPLPVESGPTAAVLARTFLYLYGAGGALALGSLAIPHTGVRSQLAIALPAVAALLVALVMLLAFDRFPLRSFRMLPPFGTLLASTVVWGAGASLMVPYAGFYFWVVLSSFYLFDSRWAWVNVAWVGAAFGFVLSLTPDRPNRLLSWVLVMGAVAVGGAMIGLLRKRLEKLLDELRAALAGTRDSERALAEAQRIAAIGSWEIDLRAKRLTGSAEFRRAFAVTNDEPLGFDALIEGIHPGDRQRILTAMTDAIQTRGSLDYVERVLTPDGGVRHIHVRGQVVDEGGVPVKIVGTAQDITLRTQQEERLRRTLKRLAATTDVALALGSDTQLDGLLHLIAERTRSLLDACGVAIFVAAGPTLQRAATAGEERVIASDAVAIFADTRALGDGEVRRAGDMLVVPLVFRGDFHGLLVAAGEQGAERFGPDDDEMMRAFATSAATAVAAAKSVQEDLLRRSIQASERERARWARELHDQTLQSLGALQMRIQLALGAGPEALESTAHAALEQIGAEVANLRRIIQDLRPAVLDDFGLVPALELLADRVGETYGVVVETRIVLGDERDRRLGPELEQTVYRIVQEALANAGKHAQARSAVVEVVADGDDVLVCVRDDGHGFDQGAVHDGFGLAGMRERVRLARGRLTIDSGVDGTRIEAGLPIAASAPRVPSPVEPPGASVSG